MKTETITGKQMTMLMILFVFGSAVVFTLGIAAKRDLWLSMLLAIGAGIGMSMIYARLASILPGKDFFETIECFFGKVFSKVLFAIIAWYVFENTIIVLAFYGQFVGTVGLPETPQVVLKYVMLMLCAFTAIKGIEVLARWSQIFLIVVIVFISFGLALALQKVDMSHVQPFLYEGFEPVLKASYSIVMFPLLETIAFLLVIPAIKPGASGYKVYAWAILIGGLILLITSTVNVLVMDIHYTERSAFSTYEMLSVLKVGQLFTRLEIIAAMFYTLSIFVKLSILLLATSKCISRVLNFGDYRFLVIPVTLLMGAVSAFSFQQAGFSEWINSIGILYGSVYNVLLPILIIIFIEIKYRILKKQNRLPC